ncbi:hypothetical protein KUA24_165 [Vibrio phage HNL01]|nr:hypothetical protein KUA24_165 [Vibrio phage HNL01]
MDKIHKGLLEKSVKRVPSKLNYLERKELVNLLFFKKPIPSAEIPEKIEKVETVMLPSFEKETPERFIQSLKSFINKQVEDVVGFDYEGYCEISLEEGYLDFGGSNTLCIRYHADPTESEQHNLKLISEKYEEFTRVVPLVWKCYENIMKSKAKSL